MSSSTKPEAFSFETEFSANGEVLSAGQNFRRYRHDEVEKLCAEAREEGLRSVEAETERRVAAAAEAIVSHLQPVLPFAHNLTEQLRKEACELAMAAARQIAGAALAHMPEEAVQECLSETLSLLPSGLKLVLNVQPDIAERLEAVIRPRLPSETELVVQPDARAPAGSWRLTWDRGGFEHNPEELSQRLQDILDSYLSQPIDEQGDLFAGLG